MVQSIHLLLTLFPDLPQLVTGLRLVPRSSAGSVYDSYDPVNQVAWPSHEVEQRMQWFHGNALERCFANWRSARNVLLFRCFFICLLCFNPVTTLQAQNTTKADEAVSDDQNNWQIGTGKVEITPPEPIWMAGYASRTEPSQDVLSALWAKSLLIEDETGNRLLLVTLDLVGIERSLSLEICQALSDHFQLDRCQISLACSHTHSGPVVGNNLRPIHFYQLNEQHRSKVVEYAAWLEEQIVKSVELAFQTRQSAKLFWGCGHADFATNRRNNPEVDVPLRRTLGNLEGPVDHSVPVLVAKDSDGNPLAIVFGYACHATVLSGYRITGDYPGFAQIAIEKCFPNCNAMFWAGCGGDQNPLPRRTEELAEHYGRALGTAVESVVRTHQLQPITGKAICQYNEIPLTFADVPDKEVWAQRAQSTDKYEAMRANLLLRSFESESSLATTYPYPVQTWRLGTEIEWIHLGGEVVVDYAARLKSERLNQRTWVTAYANDVMAYIPSRRVLREGGYEGATAMVYYGLPSAWAESVEEDIIAEVTRQLDQSAN